MISITTLGKFSGPPTKRASAKYGGGTSAGIQPSKPHKFPSIKITKIDKEEHDINITILKVKEL